MREILFRAKRIDNGNWAEGDLRQDRDLKTDDISGWDYYATEGGLEREPFEYEIEPETLCQYTGLTDKNGKRIWENDIVSAWSEGKHAIGKVKRRIDGLYIIYPAYQKTEFWRLCPDGNGKTEVEVIENIFDNQELLKGE